MAAVGFQYETPVAEVFDLIEMKVVISTKEVTQCRRLRDDRGDDHNDERKDASGHCRHTSIRSQSAIQSARG